MGGGVGYVTTRAADPQMKPCADAGIDPPVCSHLITGYQRRRTSTTWSQKPCWRAAVSHVSFDTSSRSLLPVENLHLKTFCVVSQRFIVLVVVVVGKPLFVHQCKAPSKLFALSISCRSGIIFLLFFGRKVIFNIQLGKWAQRFNCLFSTNPHHNEWMSARWKLSSCPVTLPETWTRTSWNICLHMFTTTTTTTTTKQRQKHRGWIIIGWWFSKWGGTCLAARHNRTVNDDHKMCY